MLIWPRTMTAPIAHPDLPDDLRSDYDEARSIVDLSPRGAAALLRLTIEQLCTGLAGEKKLDKAIGALFHRGLLVQVQQALDVLRVVGNNAVHPLELDLRDDRPTARAIRPDQHDRRATGDAAKAHREDVRRSSHRRA